VPRKLQISIDKDQCVGNQRCIKVAEGVFRADANGQSDVVDPTAATEEAIIEAGYSCPVAAISVVDAETGEDLLV
jgi:ferredoxin